MDLKMPLTVEEQISRLIEHKMDIANVDSAKRFLAEINYYRFTGYALQFRDVENQDDYAIGTKFEDVVRLYQFDSSLRCTLKPHLDTIELYARTQIAYGFSLSKCLDPPHDQHYEPSNFYNESSHSEIITSSLAREQINNKDSLFVIHHLAKYNGKMPLWVIVELLSFTNLSKLYRAMYYSEQDVIAKRMGTSSATLSNHLHCLSNLRNKVAHAGRLYNTAFNPPVVLGRKYLQRHSDTRADTLFAYILAMMRRLPNIADRASLVMAIINAVSVYADCVRLPLLGFPDRYAQLLSDSIM